MNSGKIKTILINPPFSLQERYGQDLKNFGAMAEPLGLAYLAANLEKNDFPVSIIDAMALGWSNDRLVYRLTEENPDLIGITFLTPMYRVVQNLIKKIKEKLPSVKIIVGGAHATALPKEILMDFQEVDYVCLGEGEKTILELAEFLSGQKNISEINGLVHRQGEQIVFNRPREFESDLDSFPAPARHLLPMEKYHLTASRTKGVDYCPTLIVARGCPFDCYYCSHPFGRSFRHHSIERVVGEVEDLMAQYNIRQMNLEADTLTIDKKFLLDLCQALISSGISQQVSWTCESRADTIDEEMLVMMKKAGCWQISYGVESGVQRLLDIINKGEKLEQFEKIFALTKKAGITIRGFFMLGLPGETIQESWQTINFAKKLDPLWAQFTVTIPYPGTPLFNQLKEKNQIRTFDWSRYNTWAGWAGHELPYISEGRNLDELRRLQRKALVAFYLRPRVFFRFVRQINSFKAFKKYFLGFLILLKNKLD